MRPRQYQVTCISKIYSNFKKSNRALLCAATGTGKTVMGAIIARNAVEQGKKVNFYVPRTALIGQTMGKMRNQGLNCGVIAGDWRDGENPAAPVQVISVQALYGDRSLDWLESGAGTVNIVDECHITSFFRVLLERCPKRYNHDAGGLTQKEGYWLGMTGTLWRLKPTESLGEIFSKNSLVCAPMPSALMDWGYLVKPVYIRIRNMGHNIETSPSYALEQWKKAGQGRLTLAFCPSIAFAKELTKEFNNAGIPSAWISASATSGGSREEILSALSAGRVRMVASYDCLSEGVDVPSVSCGMFLRATENPSKYYQQLGRLVRPFKSKEGDFVKTDAIALDFVNIVRRYGRLEDLEVTADDLEIEEKKVGGKIPLKACPHCNAWNDIQALICAVCKQAFEILGKEKESPLGDLVIDLMPHEKRQYALYQRLLRSCYERRESPDEAIKQFIDVYGKHPPDAWRNYAVLPRGASEEEKQKYARYLEEVAQSHNRSKQWQYHQMSLDLGF